MSREKCGYCDKCFTTNNPAFTEYGGVNLHRGCYERVSKPRVENYVRTTKRLTNAERYELRFEISIAKNNLVALERLLAADDELVKEGLQSKTVRVITGELIETIPYDETKECRKFYL